MEKIIVWKVYKMWRESHNQREYRQTRVAKITEIQGWCDIVLQYPCKTLRKYLSEKKIWLAVMPAKLSYSGIWHTVLGDLLRPYEGDVILGLFLFIYKSLLAQQNVNLDNYHIKMKLLYIYWSTELGRHLILIKD